MEEIYKPGDVAKMLNVSPRTVQNYDKRGLLHFSRTSTGRRYITKDVLRRDLRALKRRPHRSSFETVRAALIRESDQTREMLSLLGVETIIKKEDSTPAQVFSDLIKRYIDDPFDELIIEENLLGDYQDLMVELFTELGVDLISKKDHE